ncbi:MAG: agmatine deiminase [Proteobacteria bacterium]|nr:MAG: agmatine deiminase [Pseudomonadota bacterium]
MTDSLPSERGATPAALGYHWPAEWERHRATWLSWPHNPETWPTVLEAVEAAFGRFVAVLAPHEAVEIGVGDDAREERARRAIRAAGHDPDRNVRFHRYPTTDAWCRDHGPIFVVRDAEGRREVALVDFRFDNWGRKYPGWELDDAVPRHVEKILGLPRFASSVVLEGGGIEGDGLGTVITTESCLLNPNRGPGRTREAMERVLADFLGAKHVVWLHDGIEGDDTDGHVDDLVRFVAPGVVVAVACDDPSDPNHAPLAENRRRLAQARDARGRPLEIVDLPMPPRIEQDGLRSPASHANFYLGNGVALLPVFGGASDARATAILRELLPRHEVVPIRCNEVVSGFGAIHCVTQQEPAPSP